MFGLFFHRPIIIIGMHRSGTSLVAKLLNDGGVDMGHHREHNEESLPFLNVNEQVFRECGMTWLTPGIIPTGKTLPHSAMSMYVNHFELDPEDFKWAGKPRNKLIMWLHNKPWGFKDPRNSFTLHLWLKLFPKARVIHVVRHPAAVADSLRRRNKIPGEVHDERLNDLNFNLNLWKQYVESAEALMKVLPKSRKLTLRYEDLLKGGLSLTTLGRFVGKDLVKSFTVRIHPDRGYKAPDLDLSSVRSLLHTFGYED